MKKTGLDEHDAFRRLQKLASDKNRKLIEIAQMILTAEEALDVRAAVEVVTCSRGTVCHLHVIRHGSRGRFAWNFGN